MSDTSVVVKDFLIPRLRVIDRFWTKAQCDEIVGLAKASGAWSLSNPQIVDFKNMEDAIRAKRQWDDRLLSLDREFARTSYPELLRVTKPVIDRIEVEVATFFGAPKVISVRCDVARWYGRFKQDPHVDFFPSSIAEGGEGLPDWVTSEILARYRTVGSNKQFSAMLYLNEAFCGGELFFPRCNMFTLSPRAGRLVMFRGDFQHEHGVRRVQSGTRFVLSTFWRPVDQQMTSQDR